LKKFVFLFFCIFCLHKKIFCTNLIFFSINFFQIINFTRHVFQSLIKTEHQLYLNSSLHSVFIPQLMKKSLSCLLSYGYFVVFLFFSFLTCCVVFFVVPKQHRKREEKRSRKERKITYTTSQRVLELYERQAAAVGLYKSHF